MMWFVFGREMQTKIDIRTTSKLDEWKFEDSAGDMAEVLKEHGMMTSYNFRQSVIVMVLVQFLVEW
jgi:hypothetical protein